MTLKTLRNFFFVGIILILNACSQAGWVGYYKMNLPGIYKNEIDENTGNETSVNLSKQELFLSLPRDCSSFRFAGIGTPFTPPIPLPVFRSWTSEGKNGDGLCHYFLTCFPNPAPLSMLLFNDFSCQTKIIKF